MRTASATVPVLVTELREIYSLDFGKISQNTRPGELDDMDRRRRQAAECDLALLVTDAVQSCFARHEMFQMENSSKHSTYPSVETFVDLEERGDAGWKVKIDVAGFRRLSLAID